MADTTFNEITLSREELYEEVWSTPSSTLARKFGFSDVALGKLCRKFRVPKPTLGYWARVSSGQKIERTPLPKCDDPRLQKIQLHRRNRGGNVADLSAEVRAHIRKGKEDSIEVSALQSELHPLVAKTLKSLTSSAANESGLVRSRAEGCFHIVVSKALIERSIRIADALVRAFEKRALAIEFIPADGKKIMGVRVLDELFSVSIEEQLDRKLRVLSPRQLREKELKPWLFRSNEYDFTPNGKLVLRVGGETGLGNRRNWSDSRRTRLEDCLNSFLSGLYKAADAVKKSKAERERQKLEWAERERQWQEEKLRREREEQRKGELYRMVELWSKTRSIEQFLDDLETEIQKRKTDTPNALVEWLNWARNHAKAINPINGM